jgi:hypothetical protein
MASSARFCPVEPLPHSASLLSVFEIRSSTGDNVIEGLCDVFSGEGVL